MYCCFSQTVLIRSDRILQEAQTSVAPPPHSIPTPSVSGPATTSVRQRREPQAATPSSSSESDDSDKSKSGSDSSDASAPIADKGKGKANLKGQQSEVGSYHDTDIEDLPGSFFP